MVHLAGSCSAELSTSCSSSSRAGWQAVGDPIDDEPVGSLQSADPIEFRSHPSGDREIAAVVCASPMNHRPRKVTITSVQPPVAVHTPGDAAIVGWLTVA